MPSLLSSTGNPSIGTIKQMLFQHGKEDKFYYPGKIKKGEACYEKKGAGGRRFFSEKLRPVFLQSWFLTVKPQFTGVDRNGEFHQQGIDEGAGGPDPYSDGFFDKGGSVFIDFA